MVDQKFGTGECLLATANLLVIAWALSVQSDLSRICYFEAFKQKTTLNGEILFLLYASMEY